MALAAAAAAAAAAVKLRAAEAGARRVVEASLAKARTALTAVFGRSDPPLRWRVMPLPACPGVLRIGGGGRGETDQGRVSTAPKLSLNSSV